MKPHRTIVALEEGESMSIAGQVVWGECDIEVIEYPDGGTDYIILADDE